MDAVAAPTASAASGTSIASQASPPQPATKALIARTAIEEIISVIVHNTETNEVRQLALAELLAAAAPAAVGQDPATYKEAMEAADAEELLRADNLVSCVVIPNELCLELRV
jgi:hypothetical protein